LKTPEQQQRVTQGGRRDFERFEEDLVMYLVTPKSDILASKSIKAAQECNTSNE
jgi:hypothetical protein